MVEPFVSLKGHSRSDPTGTVISGNGESAEPNRQTSAAATQKPLTATEIALKVGKVLGHYKMGKHFQHQIEDGKLSWSRREESIAEEAKLDGIYVIRTSETAEWLSAADTVRGYKSLAHVECAFRSLKSLDLLMPVAGN